MAHAGAVARVASGEAGGMAHRCRLAALAVASSLAVAAGGGAYGGPAPPLAAPGGAGDWGARGCNTHARAGGEVGEPPT